MKRILPFMILVSGLAAAEAQRPPEYYDRDVQRLIVAQDHDGGLGVEPRFDGRAAMVEILKKKNFLRCLVTAYNFGNVQGRCYALIALREVSPAFFKDCAADFRKTGPETLGRIDGCIPFQVKTAKFLEGVEAGAYTAYFRKWEGT